MRRRGITRSPHPSAVRRGHGPARGAVVALAVVVAACTGSSGSSAPPLPSATSATAPSGAPSSLAPSPGPPIVLHGRLAFSHDPAGNIDIWVMDLPGKQLHRLTTDPANDFSPTWSPDGTRIAFRSDRRGNDEVSVMNADGTRQRDLSNDPASDYSPAWSPDGRTIAFATDREDHTGNDVWLMDANGGNPRPLVEQTGIDEYPVWSPDGSQVAFNCTLGKILASRVGDFEVCVVNADGSGLRRITDAPGISFVAGWSPDGSMIVFGSNRDQAPGDVSACGDVFVIHPDGSGLRRLTDGSQADCLSSVASDGHIFFSSDRRDPGRESDLWVMNLDGSGATLVTGILGNEADGQFLPAERSI